MINLDGDVMQVITTKLDNGLGKIVLNRPEALHALNQLMIEIISETLHKWELDHDVKLIVFDSSSDRAFCAGGDIKALYVAKQEGIDVNQMARFFQLEYELDHYIYDYPKPIIANLDGIVMGGGVGLSYGANYKIVTENTKWAMPEMNISFFPDVGASYFLNQSKGELGKYAALSAKTFTASDVLYLGVANIYMEQKSLSQFINELESIRWHDKNITEEMDRLIDKYAKSPLLRSELKTFEGQINEHFRFNSVEEILASLKNDESDFAKKTYELLLSHSPLSLKVTLEMLIRSVNKTFAECLQNDLKIATSFLKHPDFYEGVRSVIIDKDHSPHYTYNTVEDVPNEIVESFFIDR